MMMRQITGKQEGNLKLTNLKTNAFGEIKYPETHTKFPFILQNTISLYAEVKLQHTALYVFLSVSM